ncbi:phosphohistidine phosphatase [Agromyces flavus]|uniref:Phosphohistidine phosphatase n=1 Tax=Agromyces flavus TaxID=589382 RepID=A0A1H1ZQR4_9MICO|nr:histidine phosphatase family protein [Agromyces flavus]MCP2367217.1 phosphohistidine phosphatase [Agromyces flavus]GGI46169.1 phosphohistidine phosphatase SixA [Agromyces flavus]SDT36068.1 phosphohistidine phosphatase [Agromyces flavus]
MKTLVLVRHAKSAWGDPTLADHDRPLNDRGRRDAPEMGRRLRERGVAPDAILSSTAVRARSTAEAIADELGAARGVLAFDERLYGSSPETILEVVGEVDDEMTTVLVVAHDPGMSDLANQLSGEIEHMPTCGVAEFRFAAWSWSEIGEAEPLEVHLDTPH